MLLEHRTKNEGIIGEAKHQQRRISEKPSLAGPITGLMTAAWYNWPTMSAKHTETTEAWLASCSAKERLKYNRTGI